jgi:hypothetical protein
MTGNFSRIQLHRVGQLVTTAFFWRDSGEPQKTCQDIKLLGWGSNPRPPAHEAEMQTTVLQCRLIVTSLEGLPNYGIRISEAL